MFQFLEMVNKIMIYRGRYTLDLVDASPFAKYDTRMYESRASDTRCASLLCVMNNDRKQGFGKKLLTLVIETYPAYDDILIISDRVSYQAMCCDIGHRHLETLGTKDLCCDKMNHVYVPKYRLLTEKEVLDLENRYGNRKTFPKILYRIDAIARLLGFRPGDVAEVTSMSNVVGEYKSYRYTIQKEQY